MTTADDRPTTGTDVYAEDRAYVFYSWSAQSALHPMVIAGAAGSYVWDDAGRRYLDFSSQMVNTNIGHQHPKVVAAIQEQASRLCTIAPVHANDQRSRAAHLIVDRARTGEGTKVFFTNGGAEAIEYATRMAKLHTGRPKVLAAYRSYHGGTTTAVNLSGDPRRWANDTGSAGAVHFFGPFPYRSPFNSSGPEEESVRALAHLEQVIQFEGPTTIAAVVLETIPGTAGIMPPPPGYLAGLRALCDRYGIVYVADEVMCGFGRAGEWFAVDHWKVVPDLLCMAKGLTSSYLPLGAVGMRHHIAQHFQDKVFFGGLTYNSHPMGCAAALATIRVYEEDNLIDNAKKMGALMKQLGKEMQAKHPSVGDYRNIGLFGIFELIRNRKTKQPMAPFNGTSDEMAALGKFFREQGLYTLVRWNTFFTNPPLCINEQQLREAFAIIDKGLEITDKAVVDS